MRRDHAPIVAVDLRVTDDFRDDDLRERFAKALNEQAERNRARQWAESFVRTRTQARRLANVILFGSAAKS